MLIVRRLTSALDTIPPPFIVELMPVSTQISYKIGLLILALALAFILFSPVSAATQELPRTQTIWSQVSGDGGVNVYPYIWSRQAMAVDFGSKDFSNIEYVYFNLNYDADVEATKRGVEGSFIPYYVQNELKDYKGEPYFRKEFNFGTCSKNVCKYDANPRNIKITVNTNMKSGKVDQYTRVISITAPWN